jgi:hypothetical protein
MSADSPQPEEIPEDLIRLYREAFLLGLARWTDEPPENRRTLQELNTQIDEHPYWRSLADEDAVSRARRALQQASAYPRPE